MNKISYVLISIGIFSLLVNCKRTETPKIKQADFVKSMRYVSIDGLWCATPETAIKYPQLSNNK